MTNIDRLQKVIKDLHGVESIHVATIPLHEMFNGKLVWNSEVEMFALIDHPKTEIAYAWTYQTDAGQARNVAVLAIPSVDTAADAVRAYIVTRAQKQK